MNNKLDFNGMRNTGRERTLYFAYGSNMDSAQMAVRCPDATVVDTAWLADFRFIANSNGVATLIPRKGSRVYGVVWAISRQDEISLDHYEGVRERFYAKSHAVVTNGNGTARQVMLYLAADAQPGCAIRKYMLHIITAATELQFPTSYLLELIGWLRKDAAHMSWLK